MSSVVPDKYIRAYQYLLAYRDEEYLSKDEMVLFSTLNNNGNYCYILSLFYLLLNIDDVRKTWDINLNNKAELDGFLKLYSCAKHGISSKNFDVNIDKLHFINSSDTTGRHPDNIYFFLTSFLSGNQTLGIEKLFSWEFIPKITPSVAFPSCNTVFFYNDELIGDHSTQEHLDTFALTNDITKYPQYMLIYKDRFTFPKVDFSEISILNYYTVGNFKYKLHSCLLFTGSTVGHYYTVTKIREKLVFYNDSFMSHEVPADIYARIRNRTVLFVYEKMNVSLKNKPKECFKQYQYS